MLRTTTQDERWLGANGGRAILLAAVGFTFDVLVYVNAQLHMARGKGPGYW